MAVYDQQIREAVIVDIREHRAPAERVQVDPQTGRERHIGKRPVAVRVVERGGIVGEVRLEEVEVPVAVIVGGGRAHASLLAAVFVEGRARVRRRHR